MLGYKKLHAIFLPLSNITKRHKTNTFFRKYKIKKFFIKLELRNKMIFIKSVARMRYITKWTQNFKLLGR